MTLARRATYHDVHFAGQIAAEQGRSAKGLIEGVVSAKDQCRPLSSALRVYVTQVCGTSIVCGETGRIAL